MSRIISHDEAMESLTRFENHFWKREPGPRVSIPANRDRDDDLILHAYIDQQRAKDEGAQTVKPEDRNDGYAALKMG